VLLCWRKEKWGRKRKKRKRRRKRKRMKLKTHAYAAEFAGTCLLVLSVLLTGGSPWVVGATLAAVILLAGNYSGAHVNPAISFVMAVRGSLPYVQLPLFIGSQVAGALAALMLVRYVF
jgi:aquaporin Z